MKHIAILFVSLALALSFTGCGSGGGGGGSTASPPPAAPPPVYLIRVKGVEFDAYSSAKTDDGLISFATAPFTTVQYAHPISGVGMGVAYAPQTLWYDVSSTTATDLAFSQTVLPCTKVTVKKSDNRTGTLAVDVVSCWYAKSTDGAIYLMRKKHLQPLLFAPPSSDYDLTNPVTTTPLLVAVPAGPVTTANVYFWPMTMNDSAPNAPENQCRFNAVRLSTSPNGVTGCTVFSGGVDYNGTSLIGDGVIWIKPGLGIVSYVERVAEPGVLMDHNRPGLSGPG